MSSKLIVESIKLLYTQHKIQKSELFNLIKEGTIDNKSYEYITGENFNNKRLIPIGH